jgi:hypothetical protein
VSDLDYIAQREHPANVCKDCEVGEPHACPRLMECGDIRDFGSGVVLFCDKPRHRRGEHRHTDDQGRRTWWA